jgi:hypothetical protein
MRLLLQMGRVQKWKEGGEMKGRRLANGLLNMTVPIRLRQGFFAFPATDIKPFAGAGEGEGDVEKTVILFQLPAFLFIFNLLQTMGGGFVSLVVSSR